MHLIIDNKHHLYANRFPIESLHYYCYSLIELTEGITESGCKHVTRKRIETMQNALLNNRK